jgi:hypothetical protein
VSRQQKLGRVVVASALLFGLWVIPSGWASAGPVGAPTTGAKKKTPPRDDHKTSKGGKVTKGAKPGQAPPRPSVVADPGPLPAAPAERHAERLTLPSGLGVVVVPVVDDAAVTIVLRFGTGSSSDRKGHGGASALAAEMLRLGEASSSRAVLERGGSLTLDTDRDQTTFVVRVPPQELELGLVAQAARLMPFDIEPAELSKAKSFLDRASLRERSEDRLESLVFQGFAPYERPRTGARDERDGVTESDLQTFVRAHFGAEQATLVVSGRLDAKQTLDLVRQTFGAARASGAHGESAPETGRSTEIDAPAKLEEQTNQRTAEIVDDDAVTTLVYGWALPPTLGRDGAKLELARALLSADSGRLAHGLADLDGRAFARIERRRGPGLFTLRVELPRGADPVPARRIVESALASLGKDPASIEEMEWARRTVWTRLLGIFGDPVAHSRAIADGDVEPTDARSQLEATDAPALRDAFAKYLGPLRRTAVVIRPSHVDAHARGASPKAIPTVESTSQGSSHGGSNKAAPGKGDSSKASTTKASPTNGGAGKSKALSPGTKPTAKKDEPVQSPGGGPHHSAKTKGKSP